MWYFLYAVKGSDVIEGIDTWGETSVEAEDLVVDEGGQGEVIEEVSEVLPYAGVAILAETFIVEAVDLRDLAGFVISTEDRDSLGVSDFEGNEQGDGLNGVVSTIDIVAYNGQSPAVSDERVPVPMKR
jgi:hypothetical protein